MYLNSGLDRHAYSRPCIFTPFKNALLCGHAQWCLVSSRFHFISGSEGLNSGNQPAVQVPLTAEPVLLDWTVLLRDGILGSRGWLGTRLLALWLMPRWELNSGLHPLSAA